MIAVDNAFPYWVTGAQQDSGAVRVRSRGKFASITMRDWEPLCAGGESGYTAPDPLNPDIVFGGTVEKCNVETGKIDARSRRRSTCRRRRGTPGRSRSCFRRPIRTRCISAISICSRRRTAATLDADQRRHDARRPGRAAEPRRRDRRRRAAAVEAARRHLLDRAVRRARAAPLDRHRRRLHPGDAGRRQDLAERDAARADRRGARW